MNDGSKDNTFAVMEEYEKTHPLFIPLTKANGGHGAAVLHAYRYAIEQGADWIFQTDSDGQTDPDEFEGFWEERGKYTGIFGNRTARGDGAARAFVEKVVCALVRHYFGVTVPDANAPFRLMRAETLKKYLPKLPADYALPNIMITTYFAYFKEKIAFREIRFRPREKGTNSINVKRIVKIGWEALKDFRQLRRALLRDDPMGGA